LCFQVIFSIANIVLSLLQDNLLAEKYQIKSLEATNLQQKEI
jgi:hypothetical protein